MNKDNKKTLTLCCVYDDERILLGEKKYGKLSGIWNGFGGKVEQGETISQAAERELEEECGIKPLDMKKRGIILFKFEEDGNPFDGKPAMEVHIYSVTEFKGNPTESEEMRPQWFPRSEIPYTNMWPDDIYWLPMLLEGKNFMGSFFLKDQKTIVSHELREVDLVEE